MVLSYGTLVTWCQMLSMERLGRIALILIALVAFGLTFDYFHVAQKERQLASAVSACGGTLGSIPFWPLGPSIALPCPKFQMTKS